MIQNITTLYKLSLSIGGTVNLKENISQFINTLVQKVQLDNAVIGLYSEEKLSSPTDYLLFEYPLFEKRELLNENLLIHDYIKKADFLVLGESDPLLELLSLNKINPQANQIEHKFVLYPLGEVGFLLLETSDRAKEIDLSSPSILSIKEILDKLALSIKACMVHEKALLDIKHKDVAQKELKNNEEKYLTVIDNIPKGLFITDLDDNLIFVNRRMSELSGFEVNDIIGKKSCKVFVPNAFWEDYTSKILNTEREEVEQYEIPLKYKEEKTWGASIRSSFYRNSNGDIIGRIATIIDLTDKNKKELAILRGEEKYRSIIENMQLGLLEVDLNEKIIKAYPKFCDLTGFEEHELIGKNATDIFLDQEDSERMLQEIESRKKGEPGVYEVRIRKKNGERIWVMISGAPYYDDNDNVVGSVGIHLDITKRKRVEQEVRESQQKLQLIFNTSLDAIITIDEDSIVTDWSPNAELIFGYSRAEAMHSPLGELIVPPEMADQHHRGMEHFMKTGEGPVLNKRIELTAVRKSGERFPMELTISPIKIQDKYYFSSFCRDITKRKKSQQALIDAKKAAEQARNVERQFLAHMSHEIRTPMNAVIGMTYLLGQSELTEEQKDYLAALKFSADSLMGIISDILDLSKIEAGEIELEYRPFSLHQILQSLQQTYQFKVQEKNISVEISIDDKLINQVIGDQTRIGQIIGNLLSNSSKFTKEGNIGVNVLLVDLEDDKYWIKFQVYDTGVGIAQENLDVIFDSFKQATIDTHREFGGTGLGLSIVKQLVELQGGTITVQSKIGKGTMFEILLPFKNSGISIKNKEEDNKLLFDRKLELSNLKVLIAEDNLINQKLITRIFKEWGISFDLAINGLVALEFSEIAVYDIIFMDINMPKMNGYEVVKAIKEDETNLNFDTPVVTLTAAALNEERKRMMDVGVYDFITKPFSPKQLQETIFSCLDKSINFREILENELGKEDLTSSENIPSKLFDLSHLQKFSHGNSDFVCEMIQMFLQQTPQTLAQIEAALGKAEWDKTQDLAHQLKSTLGTMGMSIAQKNAETLEYNIQASKYELEENASLVSKIKKCCEIAYPLLDRELKKMK